MFDFNFCLFNKYFNKETKVVKKKLTLSKKDFENKPTPLRCVHYVVPKVNIIKTVILILLFYMEQH